MMIDQIKNAPAQSMKNRKLLETANECGCYSCLQVFDPKSIQQWTDQKQTAICPFCGTDSIILETDNKILEAAKKYWF